MRTQRRPYYLLTGLVIGFVIGLLYAWNVQPVEYVDTAPRSLRQDFKDHYRSLIAAAYLGNSDLVRARARLELLGDEDIFRAVAEQAQRKLAEGDAPEEARALGILAIDMGQGKPGAALSTTQATDISTQNPTATTIIETSPDSTQATLAEGDLATPSPMADNTSPPTTSPPTPSRTSTVKPQSSFVLFNQEKICEPPLDVPLFIVQVVNQNGEPVPGVLVIITWNGGEERFFTGLKLEKGLGYADFNPEPGVIYTLRLEENGEPVFDLSAAECQDELSNIYWGAWLLEFEER